MSFICRSFSHAAVRQHIRPCVGLRSSRPTTTRRSFATESPSGQERNPRWLVILLKCISEDLPRGMGPPSGPGNISFKQEGLDNADTMNPYVNEPGKSKKGEGETDSAKVKGTVRPDRPQV
ncbi:hypothetical protein ACN38_g10248 [Penicillium nordicum]|uniref:Uncharacterized protein n=1 Tax=Penicillium nordicum TaxID=229535 RepID=A0A0M9WC02_9EURO|nr:hypothetical protein ACN38_g10248 [Penicillium nordicum]